MIKPFEFVALFGGGGGGFGIFDQYRKQQWGKTNKQKQKGKTLFSLIYIFIFKGKNKVCHVRVIVNRDSISHCVTPVGSN